MISELVELFNERAELELDGYCEYIADYNYIDNSFDNLPKKIYIFYINTNEGKFEFIFSQDFEIFDVINIGKYEKPDDIIEKYTENLKILDTKYFVLNNVDYIERKLIHKFDNKELLVFYLYDFIIFVNLTKRVDNANIFTKNNRYIRPCTEQNFLDAVVYSKRSVAKPGSLEEKLYHYEDVSDKERELFYKNKKPSSGGFAAAMKSR